MVAPDCVDDAEEVGVSVRGDVRAAEVGSTGAKEGLERREYLVPARSGSASEPGCQGRVFSSFGFFVREMGEEGVQHFASRFAKDQGLLAI